MGTRRQPTATRDTIKKVKNNYFTRQTNIHEKTTNQFEWKISLVHLWCTSMIIFKFNFVWFFSVKFKLKCNHNNVYFQQISGDDIYFQACLLMQWICNYRITWEFSPQIWKEEAQKIDALNKNDSLYTQRTEWKIKTADFRWFAEKTEKVVRI